MSGRFRPILLNPVLRSAAITLALTLTFFALFSPAVRAQDDLREAGKQAVQLGGRAFNSGQYDRALDYWQRGLTIFQRLEDRRNTCATLMNIGLVYSTLGQKTKALDYYERALDIVDPADSSLMGDLLGNMGSLAISMGRMDAAVRYFTEAVNIEERRGDRTGYALALDGLAQAYSRMRQFDRAIQAQQKALAAIEPTGNLRDISKIINNIGVTAKAKGDLDTAAKYLTRALQLKRRFATRHELSNCLTNLALMYFDQGKLDKSAAAFAETIEHNEAISREVRDAAKVGEFQDWFRSSLYRRYAHVLVNQNKPEDGLIILERGRNQGLARQAAQNRADFSRVLGPGDAKMLKQAQAAFTSASDDLRKLDGLEFLADEGANSPGTRQILECRARYDNAERQLNAIRADLSTRNASYRRLSGTTPPTIAELKELAAKNPDTLYIQWAIGAESTSLLFTLSKQDGVKAFVIEAGEDAVRKQVQAWRDAIHKRDTAPEAAAAKTLYATLFSPLEKAGLLEKGRYSRLMLVGDGPLLTVPYAALSDADGIRLMERMPVAVSGSFGVLTWPDKQEHAAGTALIAADPLAPGEHPLPAARQEGRLVSALFAGSQLLVGEAATKPQMLQLLPQFAILHFATHGLLDREDGLGSGLLMASAKGSDDIEILEARELISMKLAAQLAVLSACDTGDGQKSGGEGLLGLTWAFRAAGCRSIVASLWSVDDAATGELMTQFYKSLTGGKRKDEALQQAMQAVKKMQPNPFYWAAFQINGDTSPLAL